MPATNPFRKVPVTTLDGLSGSGKSTLAKRLAQRLGWLYLDSGAWYRAATWAVLEAGCSPADESAVLEVLSQTSIQSHTDGSVSVNGRRLSNELRTPVLDRSVAEVADHLAVRSQLTSAMQSLQETAGIRGIIADGRDAGTVIFPDADMKIFVEASLETRAARRFAQQQANGMDSDLAIVQNALDSRDQRDQARGEHAPRLADGGAVFENNSLSVEQAVGCLLDMMKVNLGEIES